MFFRKPKDEPVDSRHLMITAQQAKEIAKLPKELQNIGQLIKAYAEKGNAGIWLTISDFAESALRKEGFETSKDYNCRPGQTWIWWGN